MSGALTEGHVAEESALSDNGAGRETATTTGLDFDVMALAPGGTVGRYAVISVLGHGGFGITYRARDVQLGREVAIKEYLPTAIAARNSGEIVRPRSTKVGFLHRRPLHLESSAAGA